MPLTRARFKISEYNKKRKSRVRGQERRIRMVSLSLTSMVDMFAILVIFLLTNSSTVSQWIEVNRDIQLPQAKHTEDPKKGLSIEITPDKILADKIPLMAIADLKAGNSNPLKSALEKARTENIGLNVVAHENIPFGILKKVIGLCQNFGFKQVNLAVQPTH